MRNSFWVIVALAGALVSEGCGCKRPSVVAQPEIVSYTLVPAPPQRLDHPRALPTDDAATAEKARSLDELARAQETLRSAPSDAVDFLSRQICPVLGEGQVGCVKSVRPLAGQRSRQLAPAGTGTPTPEQYLVCLAHAIPVAPGAKAATLLPRVVTDAGGVLRPNVRYRLKAQAVPPPSPDENRAHQVSLDNPDWAHKQIDYAGALARLATRRPGQGPGEGVVVAHLDTGFTSSCQLQKAPPADSLVLAPQLGYDYFDCRDDPRDQLVEAPLEARQPGHGTGTSSILASPHVAPDCHPAEPLDAARHQTDRVVGIAPSATVIPVRVSDGILLGFPAASKAILELQGISFDARERALAAGVFHAIELGASVISISMGGVCANDEVQKKANEELQRLMTEAETRGIIIIAAAGQYPMPNFLRRLFVEGYPVTFPGSFPSTVAVAASSVFGVPWTQSSRGSKVEVTAPGFGVWRAKPKLGDTPGDEVTVGNGTSFSTAITAGVTALWVQYWGKDWLAQKYGSATAAAFRVALHKSAQQPKDLAQRLKDEPYGKEIAQRARPWNTREFGGGLLDAKRLLEVDMERIGRDEVCRAEAARLGAKPDPVLKTHYDRICAAP